MKIKKNDNVIINSGKYKGQKSKVIKIISQKDQIIVEKVNLKTKHIKPQQEGKQGSIKQVESPIHISNITLIS